MKKIVYSGFLRFVAVILFVGSIVLGVLSVSDGVYSYCREELDVYSLENDFSGSQYLRAMLEEPGFLGNGSIRKNTHKPL